MNMTLSFSSSSLEPAPIPRVLLTMRHAFLIIRLARLRPELEINMSAIQCLRSDSGSETPSFESLLITAILRTMTAGMSRLTRKLILSVQSMATSQADRLFPSKVGASRVRLSMMSVSTSMAFHARLFQALWRRSRAELAHLMQFLTMVCRSQVHQA